MAGPLPGPVRQDRQLKAVRQSDGERSSMPNPISVFRITTDVNRFQYFLTENRKDEELLVMDGTPGAEKWPPPPVFIYMPKHEPGDFFNFGGGILISSPKATEALR